MNGQTFSMAIGVLITLLAVSMTLGFLRLYLGPDTPNRVVSFDLIAVHAVAVLALYAVYSGARVLLDAAVITAVLGFVSTTMFSYYLESSADNGKLEQTDKRSEQP